MSQVLSLNTRLQNNLIKPSTQKASRYILLYLIGLGLLTISSKINIPLQPVPVTLQTFVVLLIGMAYGARMGTLTVVSFVAFGIAGLPILASPFTTGASMGYLIGFIPGAFLAGTLIEYGWGRSIFTTALAAFLGIGIIFACGLTWLSTIVGFHSAITLGLVPFILTEIVKITVLAVTVPKFWKQSPTRT